MRRIALVPDAVLDFDADAARFALLLVRGPAHFLRVGPAADLHLDEGTEHRLNYQATLVALGPGQRCAVLASDHALYLYALADSLPRLIATLAVPLAAPALYLALPAPDSLLTLAPDGALAFWRLVAPVAALEAHFETGAELDGGCELLLPDGLHRLADGRLTPRPTPARVAEPLPLFAFLRNSAAYARAVAGPAAPRPRARPDSLERLLDAAPEHFTDARHQTCARFARLAEGLVLRVAVDGFALELLDATADCVVRLPLCFRALALHRAPALYGRPPAPLLLVLGFRELLGLRLAVEPNARRLTALFFANDLEFAPAKLRFLAPRRLALLDEAGRLAVLALPRRLLGPAHKCAVSP